MKPPEVETQPNFPTPNKFLPDFRTLEPGQKQYLEESLEASGRKVLILVHPHIFSPLKDQSSFGKPFRHFRSVIRETISGSDYPLVILEESTAIMALRRELESVVPKKKVIPIVPTEQVNPTPQIYGPNYREANWYLLILWLKELNINEIRLGGKSLCNSDRGQRQGGCVSIVQRELEPDFNVFLEPTLCFPSMFT